MKALRVDSKVLQYFGIVIVGRETMIVVEARLF